MQNKTITMKKAYIFILSTFITLMACTSSHDSKMYNELAKADSLLMKELPDSAYKELIIRQFGIKIRITQVV